MTQPASVQEFISHLKQRIEEHPDDCEAAADLGGVLAQTGRVQEALELLQARVQRGDRHPAILHNLAEIHRNKGEAGYADELFSSLIAQHQRFIPAYQSLIPLLNERLAREPLPDQLRQQTVDRLAMLCNNLGNLFLEAGALEQAQAAYEDALRHRQQYPAALSNLSNVARMTGRLSDAEAFARRAIALDPAAADAWNNLGTSLSEQSRFTEAAACYARALELNPKSAEARHNAGSGSLMMQLYREDLDAAQIAGLHRNWGKTFPEPQQSEPGGQTERIRVGFISADFREHSVMYFAENLLEKLDRSRFDIFCYANQIAEDEVTRRIRSLPLTWRATQALSDNALCDLLQEDRLHLLIDLSGHTKGGRLDALARKPVPVMAHFIGYSSTTGLPAMDYRISDRYADPEGFGEAHNTETVIRLAPSQFNYRPHADAPPVAPLPALASGRITFGSLNNTQKLTPGVISAWSRILHGVPDSRIIIHHKLIADPGVAGRMRGMFEAFGIACSRLDFRPADDHHLETYHEIDIALDPFPYNGATTTCEALWMGVPVLSLAGERSSGRMGVSILSAVGMEPWLADSVDDYVQLAIAHASNPGELARIRQNLREQMRHSTLCDADSFAEAFAGAIHEMTTTKPAQ